MTDEIEKMTGQNIGNKAPKLPLKRIDLQGSTPRDSEKNPTKAGNFKLTDLITDVPEGEPRPITDIGNELDVVILKIRRVLAYYDKPNKRFVSTNEHNHPDDTVTLFGLDGGTVIGNANELRKKHQQLRTQQILYVYVPQLDEVCRLTVKGSALGSDNKSEGVQSFYEYIGDYNKDKLRVHEYVTKLQGVEEEDYYTISFARGEKLSDAQIEKVVDRIKKLHAFTEEADAFYEDKQKKEINKDDTVVRGGSDAEPNGPDYPEEDINPEDIPF